jgi:hypothetical protein
MSSEQPLKERESGGSGASPVGSTAAIIIAVLAVVGGFLILRSLRDDSGTAATETTTTTTVVVETTAAPTTAPPTTIPVVKEGATVVVANASGVNGAAGQLTTALEGDGYTMAKATNATAKTEVTTVHYNPANPNALAVATTLAATLGGAAVSEVPSVAPIEGGALPTGVDVLVMLGADKAGKTLAEMGSPATTVDPASGTTTSTTIV